MVVVPALQVTHAQFTLGVLLIASALAGLLIFTFKVAVLTITLSFLDLRLWIAQARAQMGPNRKS